MCADGSVVRQVKLLNRTRGTAVRVGQCSRAAAVNAAFGALKAPGDLADVRVNSQGSSAVNKWLSAFPTRRPDDVPPRKTRGCSAELLGGVAQRASELPAVTTSRRLNVKHPGRIHPDRSAPHQGGEGGTFYPLCQCWDFK